MGRLELFGGDGNSSDDDISKIEIDHNFAKRYEYNKKRDELQRFEELKKQGRVDSSGSDSEASSSEEEELIKPDKKTDAEFFDALIKVKKQDPILKDKDAKLFKSDSEDEDDNDDASEGKVKKKKPMYLKDVVSKHLIEAGPEFSDGEMENGVDDGKVKSYSEEQDELRKEFLKAVEDEEKENDEDGDLLTLKNDMSKDEEEEEDDGVGDKLDEYFGEDAKLDENMMFLKDYFRNRMWIDDGKNKGVADEIEFSEDEEEIEKQEDYERDYNFRFEENAGDRVMGHSRRVEGSVRKKDNARKSQRERKEERIAQAELERKEELKRLKNLKKKEINEKLEKIREVAGIGKGESVFLGKDDLEEDFDPEDYDRKMEEAFGDNYYEADDVDPDFGSDGDEDGLELEKPNFDKEDELLGLPKGWDEVDKSSEGFKSTRERILKNGANEDENVVGEDDNDEQKEGKRKRKRKPSDVEKAVREELMEEYYKLDYEDTIGDLKTRFKYKQVNSKRYGLTPEEILMLDDKDLNQYVSLKKLAPYRAKEWKVPRIKLMQFKQNKKLHNGDTSESVNEDRKGTHHEGKAKKEVVDVRETLESQPAKSEGDTSTSPKRSKKRRRNAELKLPLSRLKAYGKNPSKSKSKNH